MRDSTGLLSFVCISALSLAVRSDANSAYDLARPEPAQACTRVHPTPLGAICEARGQYHQKLKGRPPRNHRRYFNYQVASSFGACRDLAPPGYAAFKYNETAKLCTFFVDQLIGNYLTLNSSSDSVVSDTECYNCPQEDCPQQPGVNLLGNPGFELSTKYIGPWETQTTDYYNGTRRMYFPPIIKLVSPGSNSSTALHLPPDYLGLSLSQYHFSCAGALYHVSFDYMIASPFAGRRGTKPEALFSVSYASGSVSAYLSERPTNGTWLTYSDVFVSTFELYDFIVVGFGSGEISPDLYVDNFAVSYLSPKVRAKPGAKSLVVNGGFETGHLSPWVYQFFKGEGIYPHPAQHHSIVSPGLNGTAHAFQYINGQYGDTFTLSQKLHLVKGRKYLFSMEEKNQGGGAIIQPILYMGGGSRTFEWFYTSVLQFPFVAQSHVVNVTIVTEATNGTNLTFDNISVVELED